MKQDNKDSFMKNITLNLKHFALLFILAMFSVTASAVNVTYSLTTHVDGRTITANANLNAGVNLQNNMPKDLWRACCTYTYYSDQTMTQKITTLPSNITTVYVDYEFKPLFIISTEEREVYYYWKSYIGSSSHYIYENNDGHYGVAKTASYNQIMYALYGDAYSFNLKNKATGKWLTYTESGGNYGLISSSTSMQIGWQLYRSTYQINSSGHTFDTFAMGSYTNDNKILYINQWAPKYGPDAGHFEYTNMGDIDSGFTWNNHHELSSGGSTARSTASFFATAGQYVNQYQIEYHILQAEGTWATPIVVQKSTSAQAISWPNAYPKKEGYDYDYYYKDAEFHEKYADNYKMPAFENTVVYIKETQESYVATPWRTLVLPYDIADLDAYFGENGVRVLEYTNVEGELNGDAFRCNLVFERTNEIAAYKPYLFKADHVQQSVLDGMCHTVENMGNPEEVFKDYKENDVSKVRVSMKGVLAEEGYDLPENDLNFFFGSMPNGEVDELCNNYTYKFYCVGEKIKNINVPRYVCYFFVTDLRTGGNAPIRVSFGTESITGVSSVVADVKVNNSIYSLDGRKVNASSLDNLKRGIYIINGRKVVK